MNETVFSALALIIPLVFAIVFHEVAHGWVARILGDPTAAERNRLSLNPLRHVDPIGTVILPGILALTKAPIFGWAKPVPVNKYRLNNPRRDMMAVAAAGPGTNLVLGVVGAVLLGLLVRAAGDANPTTGLLFVAENLRNFILVNVFLALFNLLPIPPFDGSHIVEGLLPEGAAQAYAKLRPYGFGLIIVLLLVVPMLAPGLNVIENVVVPPVQWLLGHYGALTQAIAGR